MKPPNSTGAPSPYAAKAQWTPFSQGAIQAATSRLGSAVFPSFGGVPEGRGGCPPASTKTTWHCRVETRPLGRGVPQNLGNPTKSLDDLTQSLGNLTKSLVIAPNRCGIGAKSLDNAPNSCADGVKSLDNPTQSLDDLTQSPDNLTQSLVNPTKSLAIASNRCASGVESLIYAPIWILSEVKSPAAEIKTAPLRGKSMNDQAINAINKLQPASPTARILGQLPTDEGINQWADGTPPPHASGSAVAPAPFPGSFRDKASRHNPEQPNHQSVQYLITLSHNAGQHSWRLFLTLQPLGEQPLC